MMVMFGHNILDPADLWQIEMPVLLSSFRSSEDLRERIEAIRAEQDKDRRKALKTKLPYFVSGLFKQRRHADDFIESNLFVIDIDHIENYDAMFSRLCNDNSIYFAFRSPSGDGIKVGVRLVRSIKNAAEYSIAYRHCSAKFAEHYGVQTDKTCDSARACFFSFDDRLYFNPDSRPWIPRTTIEIKKQRRYEPRVFSTDEDYNKCLALARTATVSDYNEWAECGMSLRSRFGDAGFDIFKTLSIGKGHNDTEETLWKKWRTFQIDGKAGIGTYVYLTKKWGGKDG